MVKEEESSTACARRGGNGDEEERRERIRGGPRGGDRSGSLGSGRERVLSSPEWMEPVELRAGERGATL